MGDTKTLGTERHFSCMYVRMVIGHVDRTLGGSGVAEMLRRAGETRTVADLSDESSWSSYLQFRALLEAAGSVLGGPLMLTAAGKSGSGDHELGQIAEMVQTLGSLEDMYANFVAVGATASSVVTLSAVKIQPREWAIQQSMAAGFEPFEELCAFMSGALTVGPQLFGFPAPQVVEEQCQRHGAPACVFGIRLEQVDEATRQAGFLDTRVKGLEARLEEFQRTAADLVSGDDLDTVLERTLVSASRTVRAPVFVLALGGDTADVVSQRVFATGVDPLDAQRIAGELLAGAEPADWLVVEVASTRRSYGRLAAIRATEGFLSQEQTTLQAYGRFAAAALDSACALEEARRQGEEARRQGEEARQHGATARALLELSTALAEITSVDEMAARLVRAVPAVIGCDRAVVQLVDPDATHARIAVTHGYSKAADALIRAQTLTIPTTSDVEIEILDQVNGQFATATTEHTDIDSRALMAETGTAYGLKIPIIVGGAWAGAIVAAVSHDPARLQQNSDVQERLRGLAAQASTAIQNARLLDQVRHQAFHDPLTDLPNRALILDRVEQMLVRARRHDLPAAALFVDLDGFKDINDTLGHETGDHLLRAVTARLKATLRESDTIGRLGGDEFVILLDSASFDVGPELVAERVLTVLREPFRVDDRRSGPLTITASIGIATGDRSTPGELLRDADIALYRAKAAGKDCLVVFEPEMQTMLHDRVLLQMDLQTALEQEQFFLVYQPILTLGTGEVTGVEALLRWQHPTRGEIQPDAFIPMLEETGLIVDIGRWVLTEACRQAASWHDDGLRLDVAVNVSARQLQNDRFVTDIWDALTKSRLDPASLVIEITETAIMTDRHETTRRLTEIKTNGIRIAIDDFGTGHSSLAYLREFPVDILKIDRTFVKALGESTESAALVRTFVQLGKALGLETVAEGIEDLDQYRQLEAEHCDSGQGFLIAPPLAPGALREFLTERVCISRSQVG